MEKERLYTVTELARQFGVSVVSVRRMIYRGEFPGAFKFGRAWRVPAADVDRYVSVHQKKQGRQPPGPSGES